MSKTIVYEKISNKIVFIVMYFYIKVFEASCSHYPRWLKEK